MTTRSNIVRAALAAALLTLTGVIAWVAVTKSVSDQPALWLVSGGVPLAAVVLLFVRRGIGAAIALVAAALAAFIGLLLSVCFMCGSQPPLGTEAIALFLLAAMIVGLAVVELQSLGLTWVAAAMIAVALVIANNVIGAGIVVIAAVAWFVIRRRRAVRPSSDASGSPSR